MKDRKLDILIAKNVTKLEAPMYWAVVGKEKEAHGEMIKKHLPKYSSDMNAAMIVFKVLQEMYGYIEIKWEAPDPLFENREFFITPYSVNKSRSCFVPHDDCCAHEKTLEMAICVVALKSVGVNKKEYE